ncbi:MAG: magnesium transporter [Rubricoccaceae bacterium]|nr:magnesium transporter [Rubricoccaceae bacterium]
MSELPPERTAPLPEPERPGTPVVVGEELVENVEVLVEDGQRGMVLNLVTDLHPADLGQLLGHLPVEAAQTLFGWLPEERASAALPGLESARRAALLDGATAQAIVGLLDHLDTDDAADVLADVDEDVAEHVLPRLEDAEEVGHLMGYPDDTAGGLMETDYVAVAASASVGEATEAVRECVDTVDPVYVVYVLDPAETLVGVVPLKRLILAHAHAPVTSIMEEDFVTVEPDLDQEEVARIMERYDLVALPVVSAAGRLLGRITIDDIVDVIREEAEEDLQRSAGITGEEEFSASVFAISRGRIFWLLLGLVGALLSGLVIRGFEGALEAATILAMFIPIVMAMAGNAGIQSSAIAVQGLASGDLWSSDVVRRLGKELAVALRNGLVLAVALGLIVLAMGAAGALDEAATGRLAFTAGLSLLIVIVIATVLGAAVPLLLQRAGIDPALAMGPFITVSNDILGLTVFFLIATLLYL